MAIWTVGSGKTYSTIQLAFDALYTALVTTTFTVTQTVEVYDGTYAGDNTTNSGLVPTVTYRLEIKAATGNAPVIDGTLVNAEGIRTNVPHVSISGFEIKNCVGYAIQCLSSDSIIFDNYIHDNSDEGIECNSASNCEAYGNTCNSNGFGIGSVTTVHNNTCNSNSRHGIINCTTVYSNGCDGNIMYGIIACTTVHDNTCNNGDYGISGGTTVYSNICSGNNSSGIDGATTVHDNNCSGNTMGWGISNCTNVYDNICDNNRHGIRTCTGGSIYRNSCSGNVIFGIDQCSGNIYSNTCLNNGWVGINACSGNIYKNFCSGHTGDYSSAGIGYSSGNMYNNLCINNLYGISTISGNVYENTIYGNSQAGIFMASDSVCKNNIVWNTAGYCIWTDYASGPTSDYNDLYATGIAQVGYFNGTECPDLATPTIGWQTVSSLDTHSISANPLFVSAGGGLVANYKILTGSPCVNVGTDLGATYNTDYYGTPRPMAGSWDMGFYELVGPIWEVGPGKTYSTIQSALDDLHTIIGSSTFTAAEKIRVYTDTYNETVVPHTDLNPTATYRLMIEAADGNKPVIDGGYAVNFQAATIDTIDYVTISGFEITGCKDVSAYFVNSNYGVIHDCFFHNAGYVATNYSIGFNTCSNALVYNCMGLDRQLLAIQGGSGNVVYNNTYYGPTLIYLSTASPVTVKNNAMYILAGGVGIFAANLTSITNLVSNNNVMYVDAAANAVQYLSGGLQTFATLVLWQASGFGQDAASSGSDPLFVNAGGTTAEDYKFTSSSPCNNLGVNLNSLFTKDYFGTVRPTGVSAWDAGFYESLTTTTIYGCLGVPYASIKNILGVLKASAKKINGIE